jgi:hypothetical protein
MSNGSATTITVNTGLFAAGDIVTIINLGAGVCTITAGTATVTTSGSLALAQNQGGVLRFTSASAAIFFQFATPASGDIEGVTAGTGISGGGTSGTVTITNSMATEIDAKGDLIVGTGADTFARLAVGTNGHTLVADSSETTGLKWAAPAGGGSFVGCILSDSNATQSLTSGTDTALTYNTEIADTDGFHSTVSNTSRITIPSGKAGKYVFILRGVAAVAGGGGGQSQCNLYKNGTRIAQSAFPNTSGFNNQVEMTYILDAAVNDYFEFFAFQNRGTTSDFYKNNGSDGQQFACYFLG